MKNSLRIMYKTKKKGQGGGEGYLQEFENPSNQRNSVQSKSKF